ncbi:phosphotransferase enzyme family protein [Nocardia sp. CA-084685]|uniref:phosphotransferase enzyme family protein n=1 Tax=Nocardia sp. CA-084685 TaxID=3239970 RepID=UPI003D98EB52
MLSDIESAIRVARRALDNYAAATQAVITFVKFRENYVFRVDTPDGSHALRIHRAGYRSDDEIIEELELLTALKTAGVAVPHVRTCTNGDRLCLIPDDDGDLHQVDMLVWVEETTPLGDIGLAFTGEATVDEDEFRTLGALIGGFHNAVESLEPATASIRARWDAHGLVGDRPVWGDALQAFGDDLRGRQIVEEAIPRLLATIDAYGRLPGRYGLIHADFTPENVLVGTDGMTIIDFDDSGEGYYLFDLATAFFFYQPHPRADAILEALCEGYNSIRPLDESDHAVLRPMLLARGLTYLGWAADRPTEEISEFIFESIRPLVVDLADEFLRQPVAR